MAPDGLGDLRTRVHRRGIKLWFGPADPPRAHYEAQVLPVRLAPPDPSLDDLDPVPGALEIGFHAEHKAESDNEAEVRHLLDHESVWRPELGPEATVDTFLGRDSWRRVSEVWRGDDLGDPDLAFEIAGRVVDYVSVLEPIRLDRSATKARQGSRR